LVVPDNHEPPDGSETSGRSASPGNGHGEDVNTLESDEQGKTAPIELPPSAVLPPITPTPVPAHEPDEDYAPRVETRGATTYVETVPQLAARPASVGEQEVLFVPLAVSVGDGFKFGCGFFLALVLVMLIGFVLFAALFVLTSLFGLNLPITR
jgi:hypothetical protein